MKRFFIAISAALAFIVIARQVAFAQGMLDSPVIRACAPEIRRYCAHERHGAGGVRACLQSNWRRLSYDCRSILGKNGFGQRWR
jgi:hypothetical protein